MDKKISDLTIPEFKTILRNIIHKEFEELDPDNGLELKEEIIQILSKSKNERKLGKQKTIPYSKVFKDRKARV